MVARTAGKTAAKRNGAVRLPVAAPVMMSNLRYAIN